MAERWTEAEMIRLAVSGVAKVDLLGHRGTTLVTCEEVAAMAAVIALLSALDPTADRIRADFNPEFQTARKERT